MSKLGKRLIKAAEEALAIARGEADPSTYLVNVSTDIERGIADTNASRVHDADAVFDELEARYTAMALDRREK